MVTKFVRSKTDMDWESFCESEPKLLEHIDSGGWGRIRLTVKMLVIVLSSNCNRPG